MMVMETGEVMTRMVAAFTLLAMSFCIIVQLTKDMNSRDMEEGLEDIIDEYCDDINERLNTYHQLLEQ